MRRRSDERLELSVWVRLMKAHGLILRAARARVGPDLTLPQFDVMAQLARAPRGLTPAELSRPDTIYASAYAGGHSKRSLQTVTPLAARLGLEVVKRYAAGDETHLIKEISTRPGATLIAWHHEALHKIPRHLGEVDPLPPDYWPPDRFDMIWTFTRDGTGWRRA